ncbi:MAG: hypothetical protein J5895_01045 [Alphaproteobacteria bacterium]|nr:hypothetical protein [Alphaproteobacteria bacterium]
MKENCFREHYSHRFWLKTDKLPAQKTDRAPIALLVVAFVFGLAFFALGLYLFHLSDLAGVADFEKTISKTNLNIHTFVSTEVFSYILMILGAGLVLASIFFFFRLKTIFFDGLRFVVKDRPIFGAAHSFEEKLSNYSGVRLRLKFCQYGLFSKNKFIIELYHKDASKIIPLYISTSKKGIRALWRNYALKFALPPIHISEKGMVSHNANDMARSYADAVKTWRLPANFMLGKNHSQDFVCKQKKDKKLIKQQRVVFDLYSILNVLSISLLGALFCYALISHKIILHYVALKYIMCFYVVVLALMLYAYLSLVQKDILLICDQKIIVFRKILFVSIKDSVIDFQKIKGIDIVYAPTTDRYALNVVTDTQTVVVFNKFSPEDLRWIRGFLIGEIIA